MYRGEKQVRSTELSNKKSRETGLWYMTGTAETTVNLGAVGGGSRFAYLLVTHRWYIRHAGKLELARSN